MAVPEVVFGFGAHSGIDDGPELPRVTDQADRDGLDVFSLSDHPYLGGRLDAYAAIGFVKERGWPARRVPWPPGTRRKGNRCGSSTSDIRACSWRPGRRAC